MTSFHDAPKEKYAEEIKARSIINTYINKENRRTQRVPPQRIS